MQPIAEDDVAKVEVRLTSPMGLLQLASCVLDPPTSLWEDFWLLSRSRHSVSLQLHCMHLQTVSSWSGHS